MSDFFEPVSFKDRDKDTLGTLEDSLFGEPYSSVKELKISRGVMGTMLGRLRAGSQEPVVLALGGLPSHTLKEVSSQIP